MAGWGLLNSPPFPGGLLAPQSSGLLGGMPTFATMYPEVVAGQTLPTYRPSEEQRAAMLREVLPDLAPVQIIKSMVSGIGGLAMQANAAMPWAGGDPTAVGLYPDGMAPEHYPPSVAGGMDPSVMIPFATDVAGMATTGSLAAPAVRNATGMGIRAYHGSPHDFDRFSMDKIGTGEGAHAYGHGLYFAESPGVAQSYKEALANRKTMPGNTPSPLKTAWSVVSGSAERAAMATDDLLPYVKKAWPDVPDAEIRSAIDEAKAAWSPGRMYEVDINASPDEFLDWDKPLSEQPEGIRRALGWTPEAEAAYNKAISSETDSLLAELEGRGTYTPTKAPVPKGLPPLDATGAEIMKGTSVFDNVAGASMSEKMRNAGIKGIRYKDAGSRSAEGGTSNYVVFDDKNINILKKYGIAGLTAGGAGAAALGGSTQDASAMPMPSYTTGGRF